MSFFCEYQDLLVAFKSFNTMSIQNERFYEEFEKECTLISSLSHPNIITFYGAVLGEKRCGIVIEYADLGDISLFLHENPNYDKNEKIRFCKEISNALSFIHKKNIIRIY